MTHRAPPTPQRGMALIPALLIVGITAGLAAGLASRLDAHLQEAIYRRDEVQARQLLEAALDYASAILQEDARISEIDTPAEIWAANLGTVPVEGGLVRGAVQDAQSRFNVNNLLDESGLPSPPDIAAFDTLLRSVGTPKMLGQPLAAALADRYRERTEPLVDVDEIAALAGLSAAVIERAAPWLVALPRRTSVNLNTAAPEVIAAYLPGISPGAVQAVVTEGGNRKVFNARRDFGQAFPQVPMSEINLRFALASRYFQVEGQVQQGRARLQSRALLEREGRRLPKLIYVRMTP